MASSISAAKPQSLGCEEVQLNSFTMIEDSHDWELELDVTCGDYLFGMLQGTRAALYAIDGEPITVTVQEVTPQNSGMGALTALYEDAVGISAAIVNINAYHQPGVETGKKAAGEVLALHKRVQIEMICKIIAQLAANDRGLIAEGSCHLYG